MSAARPRRNPAPNEAKADAGQAEVSTRARYLAAKIAQAPGLDGNSRQNEVLGKTNDPALQARYEHQELKRRPK
jgi:hypothetical protein